MKVNILGILVDNLSMAEIAGRVVEAVSNRRLLRIVTANPEMIYTAAKDDNLKEMINSADLVTPDGVGVVWAARYLGNPVKERVTGIDLAQALFPLAAAQGWRVFLLGGKPGVTELAAAKIAARYPGIVLKFAHGYFRDGEENALLEEIKGFPTDLLLVGLGAPRQEHWISRHPGLATVSMGVGGTFDVLSGNVKRAPEALQAWHLEWLYRLGQEPSRWRRQLVLPLFAWQVILNKLKLKFLVFIS